MNLWKYRILAVSLIIAGACTPIVYGIIHSILTNNIEEFIISISLLFFVLGLILLSYLFIKS